ncbi:MAG: hypothetical protein IT270_06280 [Saprospiraceae bacterium]|nr:hypothetical protein [Saprospiraceae bacterium]
MQLRLTYQILIPMAFLATLLFAHCDILSELNQQWELIGTKNINYTLQKDALQISKASGNYSALKIVVKRSPLKINQLIVTYADGQTQSFNIGKQINMGEESSVFNLPTGGRTLRKVEIAYDNKGTAGKKAGVELWGKK